MNKKISAYQRVYAQIRRDILDGNYKTGMLLPPEPELEKIFQVSRTTIRKAISMMHINGILNSAKESLVTLLSKMSELSLIICSIANSAIDIITAINIISAAEFIMVRKPFFAQLDVCLKA